MFKLRRQTGIVLIAKMVDEQGKEENDAEDRDQQDTGGAETNWGLPGWGEEAYLIFKRNEPALEL